jgi:hypothetical protein
MIKTQLQRKSPKALMDGYTLHADHPTSFLIPDETHIEYLKPGWFAKVGIRHDPCNSHCRCCSKPQKVANERFWLEILERNGDQFLGRVDNHLLHSDSHKIRYGDYIRFTRRNILDVTIPLTLERLARAIQGMAKSVTVTEEDRAEANRLTNAKPEGYASSVDELAGIIAAWKLYERREADKQGSTSRSIDVQESWEEFSDPPVALRCDSEGSHSARQIVELAKKLEACGYGITKEHDEQATDQNAGAN